jgi:rhamnosyltransferase
VSGFAPKIAAVVVLYHPGLEVIDNIRSWAGQVETVYAVDNSETSDPTFGALVTNLWNASYLAQGENRGIARALNIGVERAIEQGYDFLLTMDQDSTAAPDMVARMLVCLNGQTKTQIGIVSPFHVTKSGNLPGREACQDVMTPMTSGCLLNLAAYRSVGPFRDDFFIDFVDNEYCLRLRRAGFSVIRANLSRLDHNVGDTRKFGPFIATNHSPLRRYYKTRNRSQVFREYVGAFPGHCLFDLVRLMKEIASIILFEGDKLDKLRMMWRGWRDFRQGKFGKYGG